MNHRLALIDTVAAAVCDERRRHFIHHVGPLLGSCENCREQSTFIVDEIGPILLAAAAAAEKPQPQPLTVEVSA